MRTYAAIVLASVLACAKATPLDDFLAKEEPAYNWTDTGARINTLLGNTGYVLNVTSLQWLDTSKAAVQTGGGPTAIWSHQVVVVMPPPTKLKIRNRAAAYLTGSCNHNPAVPKASDEDIIVADTIAANIGSPVIAVFQLPNCPIIYPSDPSQKSRSEDAVIAWAWNEYLKDPNHDPEWFPRLPMVKGAMQSMRGAQDFMTQQKLAEVEGWMVAGASKRGWTTWMVGSAECGIEGTGNCPKIVALAPLVPIVPDINREIHRQWQSYGGFTFAFSDYTAVNFTTHVDDPIFNEGIKIVDPGADPYPARLARIPKIVVLSSDDEFMQFDWSDIWYDKLQGEKHMLIAPDSEHSLASGIPEVLETIGNVAKSVFLGHTEKQRPHFDYTVDNKTGTISVTIPPEVNHTKVVLRTAETLQSTRRDFRWVRQANNHTEACKFPGIPLKKPFLGGNCLSPIIWVGKTLEASPGSPGTYTATAPRPLRSGHWTGYYIEVFFPSDTGLKTEYQLTTPGFVYPDTLPFADCHGAECKAILV